MTVARFEGTGPVARYWLGKCEGFAVTGGARGVVEELIRDDDPHVTTRLVVRTRAHRRRIVAAGAIASVVPAERTLVVAKPRKPRRVHRERPRPSLAPIASRAASGAARLGPPAQAAAVRAATLGPPARAAVITLARAGEKHGRRAAVALAQSLRLFAREALATGTMLVQAARRNTGRSMRRNAARSRRRR